MCPLRGSGKSYSGARAPRRGGGNLNLGSAPTLYRLVVGPGPAKREEADAEAPYRVGSKN
jgi:hypothetical protein